MYRWLLSEATYLLGEYFDNVKSLTARAAAWGVLVKQRRRHADCDDRPQHTETVCWLQVIGRSHHQLLSQHRHPQTTTPNKPRNMPLP